MWSWWGLDVVCCGSAARPEVQPDLIRTSASKTAKVTLADCLACSGCVTSAETVLITQQSALEFRSSLGSGRFDRAVVTLSPQAVASIAAHFHVPALAAYKRLVTYFRGLGVHHVFDSAAGSNVSLLETAEEFVAHYRRTRVRTLGTTSDGDVLAFVRSGDDGGAALTHGSGGSGGGASGDGAVGVGAGGDGVMDTEVDVGAAGAGVVPSQRKRACVTPATEGVVPLLSSACPG